MFALLLFGAVVEDSGPDHGHTHPDMERIERARVCHFLCEHTGLARRESAAAVFGGPGRRAPTLFGDARPPEREVRVRCVAIQFGERKSAFVPERYWKIVGKPRPGLCPKCLQRDV